MRILLVLLTGLLFLTGCQRNSTPTGLEETPNALAQNPTATPEAPGTGEAQNPHSQPIVVSAVWGPITGERFEALTESQDYVGQLTDLEAAEPQRTYQASDFADFLPPDGVTIGQTWELPETVGQRFLSQLHPDVRTAMNFNGSGAHAIVSSESDEFIEILFRLHAQFELANQLFISPSQFDGRMIVNTGSGQVEYFSVEVPPGHGRNIAFEQYSQAAESGVGLIETMSLSAGAIPEVKWDRQMATADAREFLADAFFEFHKIDWVPIDQALKKAKDLERPVFAVILEGALDDQSC